MNQRAERDQRDARLAAGVVVIVGARTNLRVIFRGPAAHIRFGFEAQPRCAGHGEDRDESGADAEERGQDARAGKDQPRNSKDGVAGDAAEAGGQRPALGRGQKRRGRGGCENAEDTESDAQHHAADPATSHETQSLGRDRHDGGDGAEADELHQQIGDDRARSAEQIADVARGRVVERRIAGGPADERQCERAGAHEQGGAQDFRQPARRKLAKLLGKMAPCMAAHMRRSLA